MKFSVSIFLAGLVIGCVCLGANYVMMRNGNYFPALIILGSFCIGLSIATLLFPGAEPGPEIQTDKKMAYSFKHAKPFNKVMWVILGLTGAGTGIYFVLNLEGIV